MASSVQQTNDDSTSCKYCAVKLGYWSDPFIDFFYQPPSDYERRKPEINRGYFVRVKVFRDLVTNFAKAFAGRCQVISLGAGFDTLFWVLHASGLSCERYIEIDLPEVVAKKVSIIRRHSKLLDALTLRAAEQGEPISGACDLLSDNYSIMGADLCDTQQVSTKLHLAKLTDDARELPTLVFSECVLVYMPLEASQRLLQLLTSTFRHLLFLNYEQVNASDKFGQVMLENLRGRGLRLPGLVSTVDAHEHRLQSLGFELSKVRLVSDCYRALKRDELAPVERLEFLDETHLLMQLLSHYCFSLAAQSTDVNNPLRQTLWQLFNNAF